MLVSLVGWSVSLTLAVIAAFHAYWAFGGLWPARSEAELVRTVIGITRAEVMPPTATTLVVVAMILAAAGFVVARITLDTPSLVFIRIPLGVIALVFLARGIAAYLPGPFAHASEPFATLNALYFSPLVLLLGAAFAFLALAPSR
ncbi:MAG: hypothetical protein CMF74_05475 [Maricaulis sp.]|jgi:hypothetical protein|nr:hypothetical protein [Maricaulis sp.]HAQ36324.1 hypothetical protein [Alphaproteobacteria bacterium]|tara:strand:- start:577 stop:1011 length:435 start_codon:yes stop_codon:yes gene_type:complete